MEPTEVADVLERAAEVIEEKGWCKSALVSDDGRVCLYGAVLSAASSYEATVNAYRGGSLEPVDDDLIGTAYTAIWDRLREQRLQQNKRTIADPIQWNDHEASDKYEVIDLLKSVAKDLRNGEVK